MTRGCGFFFFGTIFLFPPAAAAAAAAAAAVSTAEAGAADSQPLKVVEDALGALACAQAAAVAGRAEHGLEDGGLDRCAADISAGLVGGTIDGRDDLRPAIVPRPVSQGVQGAAPLSGGALVGLFPIGVIAPLGKDGGAPFGVVAPFSPGTRCPLEATAATEGGRPAAGEVPLAEGGMPEGGPRALLGTLPKVGLAE